MIGAKQAIHGGGKTSYDAEVEYLESDGLAFICLPYQMAMTDKVAIAYQRASVGTASPVICGARADSANTWGFRLTHEYNKANLSRQSVMMYSGSYNWYSAWISGVDEQLDKMTTSVDLTNGDWVTWDGNSVLLDATRVFYSHGNFGLFGTVDADGARYKDATHHLRIFNFSVWRDGALLFDLIPVRRGNVGFMYDRVSGEFFGNKNVGDFIIGPDK